METKVWTCWAAATLALLLAATGAAQSDGRVTVNVRPGATMKYLEIAADEKPRARRADGGGKGVLVCASGEISTDWNLNFLMRVREQFAREGMVVAALMLHRPDGGLNGDIRLVLSTPKTSSKSLQTSGSATTFRSG